MNENDAIVWSGIAGMLRSLGPKIADYEVQPVKPPPEPSAVERLAALDDEEIAARVKECDEKIKSHDEDARQGIVRVDVAVQVPKPADFVTIRFDYHPTSDKQEEADGVDPAS